MEINDFYSRLRLLINSKSFGQLSSKAQLDASKFTIKLLVIKM